MVLRRWESIVVKTIDEGLTLETSAFFYPLRRPMYVFNSVVNTKLPAMEKINGEKGKMNVCA